MPLAIELAVGLTPVLTLQEILRETEHNLNVLSSSLHDVTPRLRSMRAAFDHSWRLLSADEQRIMSQMSVFRGGCMREAAEEVTGATLVELAGLVDKSWLRMRDSGRYTLHELARQYCEEKLTELSAQIGDDPDATLEAVRRRHCTYYGDYVNSIIGSVNYRPAALGEIMEEFNNLLAALHCAIETLQMTTAYNIEMAIFFADDMMGWYHFCLQTMATLAPLLEKHLANPFLVEPQRTDVANVLAAVLHTQHNQSTYLGLLEESQGYIEQQQALLTTMQPGRAKTYWSEYQKSNQIRNALDSGKFDEACRLGHNALEQFDEEHFACFLFGKERGIRYWKADIHGKLGRAYWPLGVYAAAEDHFRRCIELDEGMGEQRFKGIHMIGLCTRGAYSGRLCPCGGSCTARPAYQRAMRRSHRHGAWPFRYRQDACRPRPQ